MDFQSPKQFRPPQFGEAIICNDINYYIGEQIGQGAFGAVYECVDDWSNRLVAKVLLPQNRSYEQVQQEWWNELNNLMQLRHPNITFIHNAFEYNDTFYFIIERCDYILSNIIDDPASDGNLWLPYVARDILHGLNYIHHHGSLYTTIFAKPMKYLVFYGFSLFHLALR